MNSRVADTNCVLMSLLRRGLLPVVVFSDDGNAGRDSRNLASVNSNSVSLSTSALTPGLCTLTATSPLPGNVALYTCPMDAAATGSSVRLDASASSSLSIIDPSSPPSFPSKPISSDRMISLARSESNGAISSCSADSAPANGGGTTSGLDPSAWPNFTYVGPSSSSAAASLCACDTDPPSPSPPSPSLSEESNGVVVDQKASHPPLSSVGQFRRSANEVSTGAMNFPPRTLPISIARRSAMRTVVSDDDSPPSPPPELLTSSSSSATMTMDSIVSADGASDVIASAVLLLARVGRSCAAVRPILDLDFS
mmetsp:Transcript_14062/g.34052  ORF Transcript_14062/g.34052 Transcript_14062/m.34052 type:complete len:310 (-) Transcript_14062:182-1111(-)